MSSSSNDWELFQQWQQFQQMQQKKGRLRGASGGGAAARVRQLEADRWPRHGDLDDEEIAMLKRQRDRAKIGLIVAGVIIVSLWSWLSFAIASAYLHKQNRH